jgi:hypothetical protein
MLHEGKLAFGTYPYRRPGSDPGIRGRVHFDSSTQIDPTYPRICVAFRIERGGMEAAQLADLVRMADRLNIRPARKAGAASRSS